MPSPKQTAHAVLLIFALLHSSPLQAGAAPAPSAHEEQAAGAPAAGADVTRDSEGHITVRAVRVDSPLRIDGILNE